MSATRLDILEGTSADDAMVAARWAEALRFLKRAAEQGNARAQSLCGQIYATGGRSVPQNWTTAAKWWRKAAEAGRKDAQWYIGVCYYYGRGVDRDVVQAMVWIRTSAAQGNGAAAQAVQSGIPGVEYFRDMIVRFTNADSAPPRHAAAHEFASFVYEDYLKAQLQECNHTLQ